MATTLDTGAIVGLCVFGFMALLAVIAAVVAVVAVASANAKQQDED